LPGRPRVGLFLDGPAAGLLRRGHDDGARRSGSGLVLLPRRAQQRLGRGLARTEERRHAPPAAGGEVLATREPDQRLRTVAFTPRGRYTDAAIVSSSITIRRICRPRRIRRRASRNS